MTLDQIKENIMKICGLDDLENDIICAFEDFNIEGKTEVIVTKNSQTEYQAYINHENAPILRIIVDEEKVVDVWEA